MANPKSDSKPGAGPPVWTPPTSSTPDPAPAASDAEAAATKPRRSGAVTALLSIIALVAIAGGAFAAGRASASTTSNGTTGGGGNLPGQLGPGASFQPGQLDPVNDRDGFNTLSGSITLTGKVTAISVSTVTLQLANGQTVTIATTSATTYHSQVPATSADVTAGDTVSVTVGGRVFGPRSGGGLDGRSATDITVAAK